MSWCLVKHPSFCWDEIMAWGERHAEGKSLRSNVFRLALWSAAYDIWQQRNGVLHQGRIYVEENILHLIKWEVRRRIEGNGYCTILSKTEFFFFFFVVYGEFL